MNWWHKLIEWIKTTVFGFNSDDIVVSIDGEIKSIKIFLYFNGDGWNVNNLSLINEDNSKTLIVGNIGKTLLTSTEVILTKDFIDFQTTSSLTIKCDFTCDDGEIIKIKNAKLKLDSDFLTINTDINKIVYKITTTHLGLKPIVFGNITVENYIKAEIL